VKSQRHSLKMLAYSLAAVILATIVPLSQRSSQRLSSLNGFRIVGKPARLAGAPSVEETVFQAQRGPSPFDRVGLHHLTAFPSAKTNVVVLYLPGTNMNGEVAIDDSRYSLPLYLAVNRVDCWTLDYRTHFVPASAQPSQLAELQSWTNEMFEADISAAARFIMSATRRQSIFVAGFSRGSEFAYLYAAAHPQSVKGLVILDGIIGPARRGSPPPGVYANDVSGKRLGWDKRQELMRRVIENPDGPAPLPQFKSAAENLDHVVYESVGFGDKGGLANPVGGLNKASVLARVLISYDRYWPNVQDYEDSFTPEIKASLEESKIPVLAFSSTNISPAWPRLVAKAATLTGSRDVTVRTMHNWGHLDLICGTYAQHEVFAPVLFWLRQHS
jgi:pimeloyl-ACP methyl ester carboxylesterase